MQSAGFNHENFELDSEFDGEPVKSKSESREVLTSQVKRDEQESRRDDIKAQD